MWRLKSHLVCPPGSFYYRFEFTNGVEKAFYGDANAPNVHTFGSDPIPETVAGALREFRKGNHLPRSSFEECLEDTVAFTCQRLGFNPVWVYSTEKTWAEAPAAKARGGCGSCGKNK